MVLELLLMIVFWAFTPVAISYVRDSFSLLFQIWIRYCSAAGLLWCLILINPALRRELTAIRLSKAYLFRRLLITAFFTIAFQLLYTTCFLLIAPAFGVLLYQSQVVFALLLGVIFFEKERELLRSRAVLLSIGGAAVGAVIVILGRAGGVTFTLSIGILMAVGAAVSWSFVGVSLRKGKPLELPPLLLVTFVFTLVLLFTTPVIFFLRPWLIAEPGSLRWDHWAILVASGFLGIAGGQGLYYHLLPRLGLIVTSLVQLLVPFITGIFSYYFFRETITPLQLLGGLLLLGCCGVILVKRAKL